ncbi:hypothetical protein EVAR_70333_1, partial [Eumeta japonica]
MEGGIMHKYHNNMSHVGVDKMVELIQKTYWFAGLRAKSTCHVQNCLSCIVYSPKTGREEGFLHNIPKSDRPFDVVHIDHYDPVDSGRSLKHILVVHEICEALPYEDHEAREADGQVERVNRSIGPMLAKLVDPTNGIFSDNVLEQVEFNMNNTVTGDILGNSAHFRLDDLVELRQKAATRQTQSQAYNEQYVNRWRKSPRGYDSAIANALYRCLVGGEYKALVQGYGVGGAYRVVVLGWDMFHLASSV